MTRPTHYNLPTIVLHWTTAVVALGLFAVGVWMVDLGYFDSWYNRAPDLHRSIGVLLTILVMVRLLWRQFFALPEPPVNHKPWERVVARMTHVALYALLLIIGFSGYFISSAKGHAVDVFDWFSIPAVISTIDNLEDTSGLIHKTGAYAMIALTALHSTAAIKHHFIDRDTTLKRMLGR